MYSVEKLLIDRDKIQFMRNSSRALVGRVVTYLRNIEDSIDVLLNIC